MYGRGSINSTIVTIPRSAPSRLTSPADLCRYICLPRHPPHVEPPFLAFLEPIVIPTRAASATAVRLLRMCPRNHSSQPKVIPSKRGERYNPKT